MKKINLPGIRIVTISGRIASGATTLANNLAKELGWKHIEGGEIIWKASEIAKAGGCAKDTHKRPDVKDRQFEDYQKQLLKTENNLVIETKLSGFCAQGIDGVFKILVVANDKHGKDQPGIRIDRLVNREKSTIKEAKDEILHREKHDLEKWRRMYANNNPKWVYWDEKYYDLVINTFEFDREKVLDIALKAINLK